MPAATMLLAEQLARPRDTDVPLSLDPFFIRLRWRKRDPVFATLQSMASVSTRAYRTGDAAKRDVALLLIGMKIEELVWGSKDGGNSPRLGMATARSVLLAAQCLIYEKGVFYASDADENAEAAALVNAVDQEILGRRANSD